jgi:hypothetical protein
MERIKQAIENAKQSVPSSPEKSDLTHVRSQRRKSLNRADIHFHISWETVKNVTGVVSIIFAGWLWMRLDFMNQLELIASEYINDGVKQARAEAKRRQENTVNFKQLIYSNLTHCQEAAEKNKESYLKLVQSSVQEKNEKAMKTTHETFVVSNAAVAEAGRMLASSRAECQKIYDDQLKIAK